MMNTENAEKLHAALTEFEYAIIDHIRAKKRMETIFAELEQLRAEDSERQSRCIDARRAIEALFASVDL